MLNDFLHDAILANRLIFQEIKNGFKKEWKQEFNVGAGGDVSSGIDLFAEKIFIKYLNKYGTIISEESGVVGSGDKKIILDPIDGSSNALSNFSYFGSSVALLDKNGNVEVAVIANYASGEILYKLKNSKVFLTNLNNLEKSYEEKIVKNSKIGLFEKAYSNYKVVKLLNQNGFKFRSPGALALSLAYARRVDWVLYIGNIRDYDIAAGIEMCKELNYKVDKNFILVSKDKDSFDNIYKLLKV